MSSTDSVGSARRSSTGPRPTSSCAPRRPPAAAGMDVLAGDRHLLELAVAGRGEPLERRARRAPRASTRRRSGRSSRDRRAERRSARSRRRQRRVGAAEPRHLDEALRVRARLRADHEDQRRALRDELLDRVLAVLRRVADVVRGGPPQVAEALAERVDRGGDVVERERRLRDRPRSACRRSRASRASSGDSITTVASGRSPRVPITSTWSAWPTSATRWPLSA